MANATRNPSKRTPKRKATQTKQRVTEKRKMDLAQLADEEKPPEYKFAFFTEDVGCSLTVDLVEKMANQVASGQALSTVSGKLRICHKTFAKWQQLGSVYCAVAPEERNPDHKIYGIFYQAMGAANAEFKSQIHENIIGTDKKWFQWVQIGQMRDSKLWSPDVVEPDQMNQYDNKDKFV